jgi:hypothetical protein
MIKGGQKPEVVMYKYYAEEPKELTDYLAIQYSQSNLMLPLHEDAGSGRG